VVTHLERLKSLRDLALVDGLEHAVHQNRLLTIIAERAATPYLETY